MRRYFPEGQKIYLINEINRLKVLLANNTLPRDKSWLESNIREYEHIIKLIDHGLFNMNDYYTYDKLYNTHQFTTFVKYKIDEHKQNILVLLNRYMLHDLGKIVIEYF